MNIFSRFRYWLQTDSKAILKIGFIIGAGVILLLLGILIYSINNRPNTKSTNSSSLASGVTQADFDKAKELEKMDGEPLSITSQIAFTPDSKVVSLDQQGALRIDKQSITNSPYFAPRQIYATTDGVVINEDYRTILYLNSGKFVALPDNTFQVTPFKVLDNSFSDYKTSYIFLVKKDNQLTLNQSSSISLDKNLKTLATISLNPIFKVVELKVINDQIYIVFYENFTAEGRMDIWKLADKTFQRIQSLGKIQSVSFGSKYILYTKLNDNKDTLGVYQNILIDFSTKPNGENKVVDLNPKLIQNNILGNLIARKCSFNSQNQITCLVKETKSLSTSYADRDMIIVYDIVTDKITIPYKTLTFSASNIFSGLNNDIYIVSQQNHLLYKIKN